MPPGGGPARAGPGRLQSRVPPVCKPGGQVPRAPRRVPYGAWSSLSATASYCASIVMAREPAQ